MTKPNIPLARPNVGKDVADSMRKVIESGWVAQGPKVEEFEREIAELTGARYVVATSSCTAALIVALQAFNLRPGSEVIVPDFTFPSTGNAVIRAGGRPVIIDVNERTFSMQIPQLKRAITNQTSGIILVHLFGHPAELDEAREVAQGHGLFIIEDAASALGSKYKGKPIGSAGSPCFSFDSRKLVTTGEGGALATDNRSVAEIARALANYGQAAEGRGRFEYPGYNFRLSDISAAVGIPQLHRLGEIVVRRRHQACLYNELIQDSGLDIIPPGEEGWAYATFQSYVIYLKPNFGVPRDACIELMKKRYGIETQIGTYALHREPVFEECRAASSLDVSESLFQRTLTLPAYHDLTEKEQIYVVSCLKKICSRRDY